MNKSISLLALILCLASFFVACGDDGDDSGENAAITSVGAQYYILDTLVITGTDFPNGCNDVSVSLTGSSTIPLTTTTCTPSSISAIIPATAAAGTYGLSLTIGSTTLTQAGSSPVSVNVLSRPVITSMSATSFSAGEDIFIYGSGLRNMSGNPANDPKVWISNATSNNTVSEINPNADGTEAEVELSNLLNPGNYEFRVTVGSESSNIWDVTVVN